jgi:asparagine synthase (glutamine-hydrolysing)
MCGIAAIINKTSQKAELRLLEKMASRIHHRGPDDNGVMIDGPVGFFHKRLSIIDLECGKQPMSFNNCTIVYNGDIYNYIELREDLKKRGHSFQTSSDTEVILHMYSEYGNEFVNLLNGMFAFIIYDRNENELFIARDHFGIKPLYWYHDGELIAFGSEIKALLAHPKITAEADNENLYEYLTFQFIMGEETMFKNIYKILPGHFLTVDLKSWKIKQNKYWEPNFKIDQYHTEEYFIVELQKILNETICQQLRSDVPLGTYLSGGIDSSLVTILTSKFLNQRIKSFTGTFLEGPEFNELEYARIAANEAGVQLLEIFPTEEEFIELLPKLIYYLDEPVAGPGVFPQYMVSKLASQHVKVVLGGQGGDEIFGGYTRYLIAYLEQALKGAIYQTNEEGEHIVSLESILPNLPSLKQYIPMMKNFWAQGSFGEMDRRYFHLIDRMGNAREFFHLEFVNECKQEAIFQKFSSHFNNPDTKSYFNKMTHFDMLGSLPGLLQVEDRMSMAVSIESRVPLLDRRIVDLISTMPAGMKFKGGEMKYLLKRTIKDIIPKQIMNRKDKMGFPVPLHIWSQNKAKGFIMDTLLSKKSKERNMINTDYVEKLIGSDQPFSRGLWGLLSLELWHNQFIDN